MSWPDKRPFLLELAITSFCCLQPTALTGTLSLGRIGSAKNGILMVGGKLGLYQADPGTASKLPEVGQRAGHF